MFTIIILFVLAPLAIYPLVLCQPSIFGATASIATAIKPCGMEM